MESFEVASSAGVLEPSEEYGVVVRSAVEDESSRLVVLDPVEGEGAEESVTMLVELSGGTH